MDVHSLYSARQLARKRGEKPLDAVIRVAKEEEKADQPVNVEAEAKTKAKAKAKAKAKQNAQAVMEATLAAAAAAAMRKKSAPRRKKQQGDLGVGDGGDGQGQSDAARYTDPALFLSEVKMFEGKATDGRRFPHDGDQSLMRRAEGDHMRTTFLHSRLRAGREARYNLDLRLLRDCERRWIEGRGKQSDGEKMRLGRVGQVSEWRKSGFLHQRGRIMTWHWKRSYWVVHNGLLWGFDAPDLAAHVKVVLPILGAKLVKTAPSSRVHPYSFTVTINPHFMSDQLLGTTELVCTCTPCAHHVHMPTLLATACATHGCGKDRTPCSDGAPRADLEP